MNSAPKNFPPTDTPHRGLRTSTIALVLCLLAPGPGGLALADTVHPAKMSRADIGSVIEIGAGEAVTVPREWTGVWDTDGYTKIWVIYSEDGSALE